MSGTEAAPCPTRLRPGLHNCKRKHFCHHHNHSCCYSMRKHKHCCKSSRSHRCVFRRAELKRRKVMRCRQNAVDASSANATCFLTCGVLLVAALMTLLCMVSLHGLHLSTIASVFTSAVTTFFVELGVCILLQCAASMSSSYRGVLDAILLAYDVFPSFVAVALVLTVARRSSAMHCHVAFARLCCVSAALAASMSACRVAANVYPPAWNQNVGTGMLALCCDTTYLVVSMSMFSCIASFWSSVWQNLLISRHCAEFHHNCIVATVYLQPSDSQSRGISIVLLRK